MLDLTSEAIEATLLCIGAILNGIIALFIGYLILFHTIIKVKGVSTYECFHAFEKHSNKINMAVP